MKHLKHLFTALLMLCATAVAAHDFEVGGIYYNILSETDKTVEVTYRDSYYYDDDEYTGSVVIPESVTYSGTAYCVTSIGDHAFAGCTGLTSITIPNSVTSIGYEAFYHCTGLTSITIPNSITSIGYNAFSGTAWYNNQPDGVVYADKVLYTYKGTMPSNTSITIKDGTWGIASYAFDGCTGLTSITIPNSVTSIGYNAFYECTGLTSITIPNSVTSIGSNAFYDCTGLTSVEIPNSVTSIEYGAFSGTAWYNNQPDGVVYAGKVLYEYKGTMPSNTSITIKDGTWGIASYAFAGCTGLTSIEIPNSVTSIEYSAFYECTGLTSITIPNSVTSIESSTFEGCTGLTSIEIPNSVISIGDYAFYKCTGLKTVYNFSNLTFSIGSYSDGYVAYYADKVYNAPNGSIEGDFIFGKPNDVNTLVGYLGNATELTLPGDYKGENYAIGAAVFQNYTGLAAELIIPNSVTSIGSSAFYGCTGLTSITIPNSVTSIGNEAFRDCRELKEVHISDLAAWCGIDFASANANPLYYASNLYLNGDLLTKIVIPEGVAEIKHFAFYRCTGLTSITIPNSVTSIGDGAFYGCSGLTSITIPNSVTSIGASTFEGCNNIEKLYIGSSVESIGDKAFTGCEKITEIKVALEKPIRGSADIFADAVYDNAILYIPNGTEQLYQKREPWNIFFYIAEMDFTGIDEVYDEVKGENGEVKTIYDLQGRKVEVPSEGLYIINGKKVVVK